MQLPPELYILQIKSMSSELLRPHSPRLPTNAPAHCWWAVLCRGDPHQVLKFTGRSACDHRLRLLMTRLARREITAQRPTAWLG